MHNRILELRATAKGLAEQRAEALEEMKAIIEASKTEVRALTDEENTKLEELDKTISALDKTIAAQKRAMELFEKQDDKGGEGTDDKIDRNSKAHDTKEDRAVPEEDRHTFMRMVHSLVEKRADEQNFNMGNNGALIPTSIANRVISEVKEICPIFAKSDIYHVKGTLKVPVYGGKVVNGTEHNITVAYSDEFSELTADAGAFTSVDLGGFLVGALTLIGRSLLNNSEIDCFNRIVSEMAKAIKRWIEKELLIGTPNKCTGALSTSNVIVANSTSEIKADLLIDMQCAVPTDYQENACWTMNPDTFRYLKKLKDANGQYLLQQTPGLGNAFPYTILGKPVFLSDNMPKIGSGNKVILYGDYSGISVNMREDIELQVLLEKYATMHAVGLVAWFEMDSKITDSQKLVALDMSLAA